jgi:cellulose synthase/poly-beta-1,6-N-acetylglucosamine synthase-like glycosyltransferase
VFWSSAALLGFLYAGYPAVLFLLGLVRPRPVRKARIEPYVSLVIPAYNEAPVIAEKIRNSLELDYPPSRLEIVVVSDGSTDGTDCLAQALADDDRVRVFSFPENRGKVAALNDAVPRLRGEVVAFSDATSRLAPDALRQLVASFADPSVGAVGGSYHVTRPQEAALGKQEDLYWRYERLLKRLESTVGSTLGAHGQLYAIRKPLYPFPSPEIINDDFVIPVRILQAGRRVVYEPAAIAEEDAGEMEGFTRRVRIMAGNVQQLADMRVFLTPLRPIELFCYAVHKAGRLVAPLAMIALALANCFLPGRRYRWALASQALFYALALLGTKRRLWPRILNLPTYVCMVHAAAFGGAYYVLRDRRGLSWKRD